MDSISDFAAKFQNQYIDAETFSLTPHSEFRQIGSWDSLTGMAILVMIKDEYGVDISAEAFRSMRTVAEVYTFVSSNIMR